MELTRALDECPSGSLALRDVTFAVVDVETTGTLVWGDRVMEVAAVRVSGGELEASWSTLVYPQGPIPIWATTLTGISDAMVRQAPPFGEIAEELRRVLRGCVFVGHNATGLGPKCGGCAR
jgi:DNA polymerase III subunit epsilon